jgi:hypothetical protein
MHEQLSKLEDVLDSSNIEFEKTDFDENTVVYSAILDKDTEVSFDIISVQDGDGYSLKLIVLIDEFDEEKSSEQLKNALMLNFITALGKFAFNQDRRAVVYVIDYSLELLDLPAFQEILDEYYYFASKYFEQVYPEETRDYAGHD